MSRRTQKANKKNAEKLQKRATRALGRKQADRRRGRLLGFALVGTAAGAAAAFLVRRRNAQQWDEYDPSQVGSAQPVDGTGDTAFEPIPPITPVEPVNIKKD